MKQLNFGSTNGKPNDPDKTVVHCPTREEWKVIKLNPMYSVSNVGNVKKNDPFKLLKPCLNSRYLKVSLGSVFHGRSIHRLVATEWIPNPENKPCVNHINGVKTDNRVENLEWVTHAENNLHSRRVLNNAIGENHYLSNVSDEGVLEIICKFNKGVDIKDLAHQYKTSVSNIRDFLKGRSRASVTGIVYERVKETDFRKIIMLFSIGIRQCQISKLVKVSPATITNTLKKYRSGKIPPIPKEVNTWLGNSLTNPLENK